MFIVNAAKLYWLDLYKQHLRENLLIEIASEQQAQRSVFESSAYSSLITPDRADSNAYYLICKQYETGDASLVAIKMGEKDRLRKGGGAKRKNAAKSEMDELTIAKSIQRSKRVVREKCLQLQTDRMLTLTFKENVKDINDAWKAYKYFNKLCKWRWGDRWKYVAVPEYQKRGAVHFHLAIRGYYNVRTLRVLWLRAAGKYGGNVDITDPAKYKKRKGCNPKRIANYIGKYLSKTDSAEFNRKRYSSGGDIPPVEKSVGWLALGLPMFRVASDILAQASRKDLECEWESEGYFGLSYYST